MESQESKETKKESKQAKKTQKLTETKEIENSKDMSIYFCYHGFCLDGFFCCLVWDCLDQAVEGLGLEYSQVLEDLFEKKYPKRLTENPPDPRKEDQGKGIIPATGEVNKCSLDGGNQSAIKYFPLAHNMIPSDVKRIEKDKKKKEIMIMADFGNIDALVMLNEKFEKTYFLDHHETTYNGSLSKPEFVEKYPNVKYFYEHVDSACLLLFKMIYPLGILQRYFSADFMANLERLVDIVSWGDTHSTVDCTQSDREVKAGIASLSEFLNFSKTRSPGALRKIANYSWEVLQTIGISEIERIDAEIKEELKKARKGRLSYKSARQGDKMVTITFLMIYTKCKNRSELGNALSQQSLREGLDPVGLIYTDNPRSQGTMKCSWRGLESEAHPFTDVGEVCQHFGGGGHAMASGCEVTLTDIQKMESMAKEEDKAHQPIETIKQEDGCEHDQKKKEVASEEIKEEQMKPEA